MRLYRAQMADGRFLYPLARTDQRAFEGAEYHRPDPTGAPFLLAEPDAEIVTVSAGRPELLGWKKVSTSRLYATLAEMVTVERWVEEFGDPASVDGEWHELIRNGIYLEVRGEPEPVRTAFDIGGYTDAPFDLTEIPEPDPDPDWDFQPNIAFAVFGPVYARLLPGAVTGLRTRLVAALAVLPGVTEAQASGERVTGVLTLPYEDNRRITARVGRSRRQRLAVLASPFRIPFADHVAGESKADAVQRAEAAIASALATLPVQLVSCARCSGLGVVPSFQTPAQRLKAGPAPAPD